MRIYRCDRCHEDHEGPEKMYSVTITGSNEHAYGIRYPLPVSREVCARCAKKVVEDLEPQARAALARGRE